MSDKIYEKQFAPSSEQQETIADFVAIVRQLRRDCPWDREQTHESVKHLLIEEAYETVEAIDEEDWNGLRKELGDLLLHVVFHSVIAESGGRFTLQNVVEAETEKLVRRHPHVFGDVDAEDASEVLKTWEQVKMSEGDKTSALEGVPRHVPSLLRAQRVQEKAAGVGFDFPAAEGAWEKVEEEIAEVHRLVEQEADPNTVEEELGDVLFALVNFARFAGVNAENALRRTNDKFIRRFQHIEKRLREQDRTPVDASLEEMDTYWDEAKASESRGS